MEVRYLCNMTHCLICLLSCSNSDTFLIMEEVYRAAIPFEEHWGHTTLVKSLWYFLHQLVTMVITPDAKFEDVIRKLVSDRYVIFVW